MNIEGTYTFQAKSDEIRQSLEDQETLRSSIPGLEQLERVDDDRYSIAIHIKYAPLVGSYRGYVSVSRDEQPGAYRFVIESSGGPDTISGIGSVQFHESGDNTTLTYKATLTINKRGTRLSPAVTRGAVTRGAAKLLIQQFFTVLADQVHTDKVSLTEEVVGSNGHQDIFISASASSTLAPITHGIVHLLRLGANDPLQEAIWASRIRRIGLISGFLLLVWIGTRLPPRRRLLRRR